jgi:hypothetical protein
LIIEKDESNATEIRAAQTIASIKVKPDLKD